MQQTNGSPLSIVALAPVGTNIFAGLTFSLPRTKNHKMHRPKNPSERKQQTKIVFFLHPTRQCRPPAKMECLRDGSTPTVPKYNYRASATPQTTNFCRQPAN